MAIGEESDEQALDDRVLTDDSFTDFISQFLRPSGAGNHEVMEVIERRWFDYELTEEFP
jgi:hypothetical protein